MTEKARNKKIISRISKLLEKYDISENISSTIQEKDKIYQCVIDYRKNGERDLFWVSTGYKVEKGNLRKAKNTAREIEETFKNTVRQHKEKSKQEQQNISAINIQELLELNTTNFNPNKETKADWDFYTYMEYWLYNIIKPSVELDTVNGYKRQVTGRLKNYFTERFRKII